MVAHRVGPSSQGQTFFRVILVGVRWVPAVTWRNNYFPRNKEALPCVRRYSWWVRAVSGGNVFFAKYRGPSCGSQQSGGNVFFAKHWWPVRWVPAVRWRNNYFPRNKEALPCGCRGPSCQPLHVQYSSDRSRSLTTLTTPAESTTAVDDGEA